jgi:curved DNA-binding protein CbpA
MAALVPRLVEGVDVRKFKLDAMDGFLLSRIDAKKGPKELALDTGLPDFSVERSLQKLEKLGVIEMIDPAAPPPPKKAAEEPRSALPQFSSLEAKYDPKELEEVCDLTVDQKKRILDVFYRLDDLDHYTLLGVTKEADKKTAKRSYFELAAHFHPDRYFGKKLGSFKAKMEVLFTRITEAHDTLVDPVRRSDYDAYLAEVATTKGMEAMLERALEESNRAAAAAAAVAAAAPVSQPVPPRQPSGPPASGISAQELQARREVLAKRLLGANSIRPAAPSSPPVEKPNPLRYSNPNDAMDALKRRYHDRIDNATLAQAKKYIEAGEDALAKKDLVQAASMFSIATKFAPDDAALAMRYQEIKNDADKTLVESYLKQAQYEERSMHWQEAARSWQKVARIRPSDAKAHERAAYAILKQDDGDLRVAAEHAKSAVAANPQEVAYHVTLAEIYMKVGHSASAKRAAETGLQLDPRNTTLLAILKKAAK